MRRTYESFVQFRAGEAGPSSRGLAVKVFALGSSAAAFIQSTTTLLGAATEPVWMVAWGLALLVLASGARSLLRRRDAMSTAPSHPPAAAVTPPRRVAVASVIPTTNWREALVAKLMADRAQVLN